MWHDPLVCTEDAIKASELILQFTKDVRKSEFLSDNIIKDSME